MNEVPGIWQVWLALLILMQLIIFKTSQLRSTGTSKGRIKYLPFESRMRKRIERLLYVLLIIFWNLRNVVNRPETAILTGNKCLEGIQFATDIKGLLVLGLWSPRRSSQDIRH